MAGTAKRARGYKGPRLFVRGFRPFFLGAGIFAAIAMPVWALMLALDFSMPSHLAGRDWHLHEMIYGYVAAIIAGFLLTAVPNWTGRMPVLGYKLARLWAVWIAGRVAMAFSDFSPVIAAIIDSAFLVLFAALLLREIIAGKNKNNLPVAVIISLFAATNIAFHIINLDDGSTAIVERFALGLVAILMSLIGGRITPSFTRNWMAREGISPHPAPMGKLDMGVMVIGVLTILAWVFAPEHRITGVLFIFATIAYLIRMSRWRGWATLKEPLVTVLHVGYLWLPVWFALMALENIGTDIIDYASAMHALSAGALGTMTMAVATRASLGHSGQELTARPGTVLIYVLLVIGAVVRISANWLPFDFNAIVAIAGLIWAAGMLAFVIGFAPLLLGRR
jgi:uncharacterized protein involved in response to NO